jgi:hypothetical protein
MALAAAQNVAASVSEERVVVWHPDRVASDISPNSLAGGDSNLRILHLLSQRLKLRLHLAGVDKLARVEQFEELTSSPEQAADDAQGVGDHA